MNLVSLLLVIAVVGLVAWLIVKFIPMPPNFANLIYIVAGIVVLLYLLAAFGIIGNMGNVKVPQLK